MTLLKSTITIPAKIAAATQRKYVKRKNPELKNENSKAIIDDETVHNNSANKSLTFNSGPPNLKCRLKIKMYRIKWNC
jgi:hypothetical protein